MVAQLKDHDNDKSLKSYVCDGVIHVKPWIQ